MAVLNTLKLKSPARGPKGRQNFQSQGVKLGDYWFGNDALINSKTAALFL